VGFKKESGGIMDNTWNEFLQEWPLEKVKTMTLPMYTSVGRKDTFTYWLESKLDVYGSIWGGSSFKFGIYSRSPQSTDKSSHDPDDRRSYNNEYGWYSKDGKTPEEAFNKTRSKIIQVIEYTQAGEIEKIDPIDLGPAFKWKIAFHYQNQNNPIIVSIFKHTVLAELCEKKGNARSISKYHRQLISRKPTDQNILDYSRQLWKERHKNVKAEGDFTPTTEIPLNTIFYGPPGTGKTYNTVNQALKIICASDPELQSRIGSALLEESENRKELESSFYNLIDEKRISFLTFHPSYTYEDFIHGIRPVLDNSETVSYELKDGPFKKMVEAACSEYEEKKSTYNLPASARVFKMSLGNSLKSADDDIFEFCKENNLIAHGFGNGIDFSFLNEYKEKKRGKKAIKEKLSTVETDDNDEFASRVIWMFTKELKKGDIVIISKGNHKFRAIGKVTGDYEYITDLDMPYEHVRKVEWIIDNANIPVEQILNKVFSQQTLYLIDKEKIRMDNLKEYLERKEVQEIPRNYVMIIDEINRGNIPRIFGELITLLEEDKRLKYSDGNLKGLTVTLPGSGDDEKGFGIPLNLYLIGTMNTADRSITTLDIALRRRFSFLPMYPRYDVIEDDFLREMLETLNQNIISIKDKDHQIGHSFFIGKELLDLPEILNDKVLPLLEEYFFGDNKLIKESFKGIEFTTGSLLENNVSLIRFRANE